MTKETNQFIEIKPEIIKSAQRSCKDGYSTTTQLCPTNLLLKGKRSAVKTTTMHKCWLRLD